jgi:hypothetical protein
VAAQNSSVVRATLECSSKPVTRRAVDDREKAGPEARKRGPGGPALGLVAGSLSATSATMDETGGAVDAKNPVAFRPGRLTQNNPEFGRYL